MKMNKNFLWGIFFVAVGVVMGLKALGFIKFELFFDGWWTLFIIVPSLVGIFTKKNKWESIIGLSVGVILLLGALDVISFDLIMKLFAPAVVILIGVKIAFGGLRKDKSDGFFAEVKPNGDIVENTVVFSGLDLSYRGEVYNGGRYNAVFGGIECDLRGAIIEKDVEIHVRVAFGGADFILPENVNVKVKPACFFGGFSDETLHLADESAPTVYISGICLFGGIEAK